MVDPEPNNPANSPQSPPQPKDRDAVTSGEQLLPTADGELRDLMDTQLIVQSAQRDERQAWTLLSAKVLFFLRARFGRVSLPSDLEFDDFGSEVMLKILGDIHRFADTGKGSFWGWIYILAQNRLNDLWRAHQRRHRIGLVARGDVSGENPTPDSAGQASGLDQMSRRDQPSPADDAHVRELQNIERECAARLPENMCRVYLMRREKELSFDEISAAFGGIKPVTLRSYYKRSRDFVKDCIQRKLDNLGATFGAWHRH